MTLPMIPRTRNGALIIVMMLQKYPADMRLTSSGVPETTASLQLGQPKASPCTRSRARSTRKSDLRTARVYHRREGER